MTVSSPATHDEREREHATRNTQHEPVHAFDVQSGHAVFALLVEKLAMPRPGNSKGMLGGTEVRLRVRVAASVRRTAVADTAQVTCLKGGQTTLKSFVLLPPSPSLPPPPV